MFFWASLNLVRASPLMVSWAWVMVSGMAHLRNWSSTKAGIILQIPPDGLPLQPQRGCDPVAGDRGCDGRRGHRHGAGGQTGIPGRAGSARFSRHVLVGAIRWR